MKKMPLNQGKNAKGRVFEVKVSLPRRVLVDLLLARRRCKAIIDEGALYTGDAYLGMEFTVRVLNGLIARIDEEVRDGGFTWNIEAEFGPEA